MVIQTLESLRLYFECGEPLSEIPWSEIEVNEWTEFQQRFIMQRSKFHMARLESIPGLREGLENPVPAEPWVTP